MNTKKLIVITLLLAVFCNFFRSYKLFNLKKVFNNKFDIKKYEKLYNQSQWVIPNSKNPVGDDVIYTYAGVKYISGENPIMINAEHPPMAKNLIGLSALILNNEYISSIFFGFLALFSFYLLCNKIFHNKIISLLLTLLLAFEPLIVTNYFLTLLDLPILAFLNFYFLFLIKYDLEKKLIYIYICGIFLGLIISTKFFGLVAPLIIATFLFFIINKNLKGLLHYCLSLIISLSILIVNYFQFFMKNKNIIDFLKLQKYIYIFQRAGRKKATYLNDSLLSLVFSGKYFINLDRIGYESHFSILWPISFLLTGVGILFKKSPLPIVLWIFFYCSSMIFSLPNSRYLILLLPYLYLISIFLVLPKRKIND